MAALLDSTGTLFGMRGLSASFGLDPLLSLIPIVGPFAGLILGLYIVLLSWMLGADPQLLGRMVVNLAIDACAGFIPLVGTLIELSR